MTRKSQPDALNSEQIRKLIAERGAIRLSGSPKFADKYPRLSVDTIKAIIDLLRAGDCRGGRLIVEGVTIGSKLDLSYLKSDVHLYFKNCQFLNHISFYSSQFPSITFSNCCVTTIDALSLRVSDNLTFSPNFEASGTIRLINARIGGRLNFRGATLNEGGGSEFSDVGETHLPHGALDACGMTVEGSLFLDRDLANGARSMHSVGCIILRGATIGGRLYFRGANMSASVARKIDRLFLEGTEPKTEDYILSVAAFDGYQLTVKNSAHFSEGFRCKGLIRLSAASFGGKLTFKGASLEAYSALTVDECGKLKGPVGDALRNAAGGHYDSPSIVTINRRLKEFPISNRLPRGAIDAYGCKVGANLYFGVGPSKISDTAKQLRREPPKFFKAVGHVSFQGADIKGRIGIANAHFHCSLQPEDEREFELKSYSLDFASAKIGGNFLIRDESSFRGAIRLRGANINGIFELSGSSVYSVFSWRSVVGALAAPDECEQICAIEGSDMVINQEVSISGQAEIHGMLDFRNLVAGADVKLVDSSFYPAFWNSTLKIPAFNQSFYTKLSRSFATVCINLDGCKCKNLFFAFNPHNLTDNMQVAMPFGNVYVHDAKIAECLDIRGNRANGEWNWSAISEKKSGDFLEEAKEFPSGWNCFARLHLEQTSVATLRDNKYSPVDLRLNNFTYNVIHRDSLDERSVGGGLKMRERLRRWGSGYLYIPDNGTPRPFRSQPFDQLAKVLFNLGEVDSSNLAIKAKVRRFLLYPLHARTSEDSRLVAILGLFRPISIIRLPVAILGFGTEMAARSLLALVICVLIVAAALFAFSYRIPDFRFGFDFVQIIQGLLVPGIGSDSFNCFSRAFSDRITDDPSLRCRLKISYIVMEIICTCFVSMILLGLAKNYSNRSHGA